MILPPVLSWHIEE